MAQYKGKVRSAGRRQQAHTQQGRNAYVQGSTVKKLDEKIYAPREPKRQISNTARKNREKAYHMSFGYVLFLACAVVAAGFILTGYIGLQAELTNSIKNVSRLERELNNLKLDNDEEYSRITSSIDMEEVKRIAIQELGMKYAEEGQIVTFSGEASDYVKQVADIPE
ncbi:cell division protein FtsL [Kineothrix sedimenti]|uniref:Cell division protein FtsL n=1 Tax=Kineothrix sedimenti TaxID=3123317 RepID=A0ABZ3ER54_9FIRM